VQEVLRRCWQRPQLIRHEVNNKDCNYADVAKRTGKDPRTIKKYADKEDFNEKPKIRQTRVSPVIGPVKFTIDEWLKEILKKKKKFRRTAKRIWEQLREQFGFQGSDRTVCDYISKKKIELLNEADEAALPLESIPGTA